MEYKGKLYGKNGNEIVPLMMHSDDVELLEIKVMMCRDVIEHLAAWFEGATLDPIKLKGMVGTVLSDGASVMRHIETRDGNGLITLLLREAYVFLGMPHKALHPWRVALDEWQTNVERETGWSHFAEVEKFEQNRHAPAPLISEPFQNQDSNH